MRNRLVNGIQGAINSTICGDPRNGRNTSPFSITRKKYSLDGQSNSNFYYRELGAVNIQAQDRMSQRTRIKQALADLNQGSGYEVTGYSTLTTPSKGSVPFNPNDSLDQPDAP